jgi:alkanesulfonate monooxygenase SsuD/methylene tetrahydromethanopterin reductase-like flavin-dependent oxidoreductase (luciferase family)
VKEVVIVGPPELFPQIATVQGLRVDHGRWGDDGAGRHVLAAEATDEAIAEIEGVGLTVEVQSTEEEQNLELAQLLEEGGPDVTEIA